ncbi:MAG: hypothetical protein E6767_11865 [Dysgonomonas sp.]|nr:hypothetical protein [Dysgonomonas sp.]
MDTMQQILDREKGNNNHIYLYKIDDYWFAYEQSAFYLYSICCVDAVFKYIDPDNKSVVLISVLKDGYNTTKNPQLKVVERQQNKMTLDCSIICKGFTQWKAGVSTSGRDRSFVQIIHNFHHHSLCAV